MELSTRPSAAIDDSPPSDGEREMKEDGKEVREERWKRAEKEGAG